MINQLTQKQEEQLIQFREECLTIGLSTDRIDRSKNQKIINWIYKKYLKIDKNPYIWYIDSPFSYNLVINILYNLGANLRDNLKDNLWDNLWDNLGANLRDNLKDNLWDNLRDNLVANLRANLRANLVANLRANLVANLRANLGANLRDNLGDNIWDNIWANLRDNLVANLRANLVANLRDNLWANLWDNLWANLRANLWANLRDNLWDNIGANLWDNLGDNIGANLRDNLGDNIGANLGDNIGANLRDNLVDNIGANLRDNLVDKVTFYNIYHCNLDIFWISFYMYPLLYIKNFYGLLAKDIIRYFELQKNIGYVFYHKDICFISEKPIEINKSGIQLHADGKPALLFADGYCLWMLNGVRMPKKIVMTPAKELDCNLILKEKNAEVRREIIRKIGINRVIEKLKATSIDKSLDGQYELMNFNCIDGRFRPYLKMLNPSNGMWHIEGVHPDCRTISQALSWRDGEDDYQKPEILT